MTIEAKRAFVEEAAIAMETSGFPRMWGRVFGALLVADPPEQTAGDLADTLRASKGSISTATRALEQMNLIERVSKTGIRQDFFRNKPGAWPELMQRRIEAVVALKAVAERGLQLIESDDPEVRRGLEEMREYLEFYEEDLPKSIQRWERSRKKNQG